MNALFAAVQVRSAFKTLAAKVGVARQCYCAIEAARGRHILNQARKLGSGYIERKLGSVRAWPVSVRRPRRTIRVLITMLSILSISVHIVLDRLLDSPAVFWAHEHFARRLSRQTYI